MGTEQIINAAFPPSRIPVKKYTHCLSGNHTQHLGATGARDLERGWVLLC